MRAFVIDASQSDISTGVHNVPEPPNDEVTVRVEWSGVNFKDAMVAEPDSRVRRTPRLIGGVDAAGVVIASRVSDVPIGHDVAVHGGDIGVGRDGGFAEVVTVPRRYVSVLPPSVSTRDAMVLGTAGFTALASILALEHHGLTPSDGDVVVTGATGGVGVWSVVALAQRGYRVVASTGSRSETEWLFQRGAAAVIGREEIADRPDRVLASERWAGAIDCVGGDTLHQILRSLRYGAAVAASGLVASPSLSTNVYPFITRNVALLGIDAVESSAATRAAVWQLAGDIVPAIDVEPLIDSVISLDGVSEALTTIRRGATRGRILVQLA
jgi:putative YhdH/YhfP family quinone oxidoreductase